MTTTWQTQQRNLVHYSARVFRQLLDALARPGTLTTLEDPAAYDLVDEAVAAAIADARVNKFALWALASLIDGEQTFTLHGAEGWLTSDHALVSWLISRTGATLATPHKAAMALFAEGSGVGRLSELSPGTLLEPELGATAFLCVESITNDEGDLRLELHGPGIAESALVGVTGLRAGDLDAIKATRRELPLGVDVFLIDRAGHCLGLPRTTRISERA